MDADFFWYNEETGEVEIYNDDIDNVNAYYSFSLRIVSDYSTQTDNEVWFDMEIEFLHSCQNTDIDTNDGGPFAWV